MTVTLPPNVHVSKHPCLLAKLSQLRSGTTSAKEVKGLIHEISLIVGCEALANAVVAVPGPTVRFPPLSQNHPHPLTTAPQDKTPLGFPYETTQINPETISLVPILRSGLGMVECTPSPPSPFPPPPLSPFPPSPLSPFPPFH